MSKKYQDVGVSCPTHGHQWVTTAEQVDEGPLEVSGHDPDDLKCKECGAALVVKTVDQMDSPDGLIDLAESILEGANYHSISAREIYDKILHQLGIHHVDRIGIARGIVKWAESI